jgi:hypothetical protein
LIVQECPPPFCVYLNVSALPSAVDVVESPPGARSRSEISELVSGQIWGFGTNGIMVLYISNYGIIYFKSMVFYISNLWFKFMVLCISNLWYYIFQIYRTTLKLNHDMCYVIFYVNTYGNKHVFNVLTFLSSISRLSRKFYVFNKMNKMIIFSLLLNVYLQLV